MKWTENFMSSAQSPTITSTNRLDSCSEYHTLDLFRDLRVGLLKLAILIWCFRSQNCQIKSGPIALFVLLWDSVNFVEPGSRFEIQSSVLDTETSITISSPKMIKIDWALFGLTYSAISSDRASHPPIPHTQRRDEGGEKLVPSKFRPHYNVRF